MIRAYFDSSAVIKLSKDEPESQSLIDYLDDAAAEVSTSVLAEVEVCRNLRRHRFDDGEAMTGFFLLGIDDEVRKAAAQLEGDGLRSLDAIHIATALGVGDRNLQFVTYDDKQAAAARSAGLIVVQPGRPPVVSPAKA